MILNRKQQIIQTAARLFHEKGYRAVSMRDLAEEMGLKAASLYNHITSKEEILGSIIMEVAERFTTHIEETFPTEGPTIKKLEAIIHMHVEITMTKTDALACMNNDWMHLEDSQKHRYIKLREAYEEKFRKIILAGMQKGEIAEHAPEIIVFSLLSTLRTLYLWYARNLDYDFETLKEDVTYVLLSGVVKN